MKVRLLLHLAVAGLVIAGLMFVSTSAVDAGCNGPNDPNPCPPPSGDKEKQFKTPVPPTNTAPAPSPTLTQPLLFPSSTPDAAMIMPVPPVPGSGADVPPPNRFPWDLGGGGLPGILIALLAGILIGLLLPMVSKSFFARGGSGVGALGKGTPGGGDTNPEGSFFSDPVGKGVPGGGDSNPALNEREGALSVRWGALNAREAALNVRWGALDAREAALNAREAALKAGNSPKSGFDTEM